MNFFFPVESSKRDIDSRIIIAANILNLKDDSKIFIYYYKKFTPKNISEQIKKIK